MSTETSRSDFRFISVRHLSLSPLNVRKTGGEAGIEQLADLIHAEGVLQNLDVYECPQGDAKKKSTHAIVAGGRRWRALQLLIRQKRIKPDYEVPCLVVSYDRAVQISLAENSGREPMHPADEFDAFRQLIDSGQTLEDVAARFGVSRVVVQRRLKLANVNPVFITLYRQGEITLEHLMALSVTDDHERQRQAWDGLKSYDRDPATLRRVLTEQEVSLKDPIARFVGRKAYEKAGGAIRRDLFDEEDNGALLDGELLRRLATQKLEKQASQLTAEGIAWVEVWTQFDYARLAEYRHVRTSLRAPTPEEQAQLDALRARQQDVEAQLEAAEEDEDQTAELSNQADLVRDQIEALLEERAVPDPEQYACAGVVVTIGQNGKVRIERDLLKPEDAKRFAASPAAEATAEKSPRVHSAALVRRLTAHRTLALQATLVQQPTTAALALTHRLLLDTFYAGSGLADSVVQISARAAMLGKDVPDFEGCQASRTLEAHRRSIQERLPEDRDVLWSWLREQTGGEVLSLLAYCVAVTLDAVRSHEGPTAADELARATGLDMRRWWAPTAENYLTSVPRARILEVLSEAVSPSAAAALMKLKKAPLAQAAEQQLTGTGWLPTLLRNPA
jgi:ParB family transcriptional regulator, chromosome partitioning protein